MKTVTSLLVLSLVGIVLGGPVLPNEDDDEKVVITKSAYPKELVKYTADHDIVNLLVPLNSLNFDEGDSSESSSNSQEIDTEITVFFVEADVDADGKRTDKGLYVFKQDKATKILEHGRDAAASGDDSKLVFFAANDGIYVYNKEKNSADKYGSVDDSLIAIAKEKSGDVIYVLTENHELFKVTNNGMEKEKIDDVTNAKQIVLDYSNNIYFYTEDKQIFVRTAEGIKKITGLPENPSSVNIIKPPFILDDAVPIVVDNVVYIAYANGTTEEAGFEFKPKAKPTAYAPEAALFQYYAYDKKLYEFNILALLMSDLLEEFNKFLDQNAEDIRSLSQKTRKYRPRA